MGNSEQPPYDIAELIPHRGGMCLLERVLAWDQRTVRMQTGTHRLADNPLRADGRLRSIHLCEYGAQAMAVHGALVARARGASAPPGLLVSLRAVRLTLDYIENLNGELIVEAECLHAGSSSLQYSFRITHDGALLAEGRAAVVLMGEW